jgi:hypothetical protein
MLLGGGAHVHCLWEREGMSSAGARRTRTNTPRPRARAAPQEDGMRGARRGGAGGTSLAATTSGSGMTTSERRVRTVQSPSVRPTSSPSASVRPPSIRYRTTSRVPSGASERNCWGGGSGAFTRSS